MFPRRLAIALALIALAVAGCSGATTGDPPPSATPVSDLEELVFSYGIGARNVLDTRRGTFTKDMILASPVTVELRLTDDELQRVARRLAAIDFFSYPRVYETREDLGGGVVTPSMTYRFAVTTAAGTKDVTWDDTTFNSDERAADLRGLARLLVGMIESKSEYQALPEPEGAYL